MLDSFFAGAAEQLTASFGQCRAELLPAEGEAIPLAGIAYPEDRHAETVEGRKQVVRERAFFLPACSCSEQLDPNLRSRLVIDQVAYEIRSVTPQNNGFFLTLRRLELMAAGNPKLFRA